MEQQLVFWVLNCIWLDTVAALIVGFLICKTAWDIFKHVSHELTDEFDENILQEYKYEVNVHVEST